MTPTRLHVFPNSPNSQKVMLVNAHLGLNLPETALDIMSGAQFAPEFLALNPNGKVPVLELSDGAAIWESNAIINWLAAHAGSDLYPDGARRWEIMRWQFWEGCHWMPALAPFLSYHLFGNKSVDLDAATETLQRMAKVLDGQLAGRDWIVGDTLTTADFSLAPVLRLRETCVYPLDGFDNILAWAERFEALPANAALARTLQAA